MPELLKPAVLLPTRACNLPLHVSFSPTRAGYRESRYKSVKNLDRSSVTATSRGRIAHSDRLRAQTGFAH